MPVCTEYTVKHKNTLKREHLITDEPRNLQVYDDGLISDSAYSYTFLRSLVCLSLCRLSV